MDSKSYALILIISLLVWGNSTISGQVPFRKFGVKNFGKKIEEPFHSGGQFRQDSFGRLHFSNYYYDGQEFVQSIDTNGKLLLSDETGGKWYKQDHFEILYVKAGERLLIKTQGYFKYDVNSVYLKGQRVFLVTNLGAIEYEWINQKLEFKRTIPISGDELWSMQVLGDTLFFKSIRQSVYVLESDLDTEVNYGPKQLSNFKNGINYLPNERIICTNDQSCQLFTRNDFPYQVISKINDKIIIAHLVDSQNRVWLALRGENRLGLYLATAETPDLQKMDLGIEDNVFITHLFEDKQRSIWVNTGGQGIVQLYEPQMQVLDKSFGLSSDNIWSLSQDNKGALYFSTSCNGVDQLNADGSLNHLYGTSCQEALLHDTKGNLWINTVGVTKVSPNGSTKNFQKEDGLMSRTGRVLFEDSEQQIWVGTRKGVHRFVACESNENCVEKFIPFPAPNVEEFDRVMAMREYEKGKYIIAFGSGKLFSFDGAEYEKIAFSNRKVSSIFKDQESRIWIASERDGLFIFKNGEIIPCARGEQLPQKVKFLQDDLQGKLWGICDGNRVFSFSKDVLVDSSSKLQLKIYTAQDGVPLIASNNDIQPSSLLLQDGKIIFPNIYGAILIDPKKKSLPQSEYFTQVFVNGELVNNEIELAYAKNDISIFLKPILLANNNAIQFQYSLNDQWVTVGKDRMIMLNNLPAGENTIAFRTRIDQTDWRRLDDLSVEVQALFYQRWYFWVFAALGLLLLINFFVRWRTSIEKQRNSMLREKVQEQTLELELEKAQLFNSLEKQKQLTHELNLSQEAKNRMYAQISHEFKSPLQAIQLSLQNENGVHFNDGQKRISKSINNLLGISNEIMELSKAESGNIRAKKNWYNINGIINEQIELKIPLANEKNINIICAKADEKFYLEIDIALIQKVIGNLLSNAIKFSSHDQIVTVITREYENEYLIAVSDNGVGIPEEEISSLTLPYFQATNNSEKGTGIGLSLVAEILKIHGSKLNIQSELGQGATFSFILPIPSKSQPEIVKEHLNSISVESQLNTLNADGLPVILAVDDSRDVLYFIREALSNSFQVITAINGMTALEILNKIEPQVIISDVNMPVMNGMELLSRVRDWNKFKAIPFLFLTGSLSQDGELQSIKAGADDILQKPIQEEYLISKIEQIIARQKNMEEKVTSSFNHNLLPKNIHNDDLYLMKLLEKTILENLGNSKLKSEDIANLLGMGEKTLRNRVKKISGLTLKEYLRSIRLEKAKLLIEADFGNLGEVAIATGFSSLSYFSKSYKAYFDRREKIKVV